MMAGARRSTNKVGGHLHRYLAEYEFRYNTRTANGFDDRQRGAVAVKGIVGKRITSRRNNPPCLAVAGENAPSRVAPVKIFRIDFNSLDLSFWIRSTNLDIWPHSCSIDTW